MKSSANNTFKYSNKVYTVSVVLYTNTGDKTKDLRIALDAIDIEEIVYEGKFNDLLLRGHVIYIDRYAQVDKMLNQHFGYVELLFALNKNENDKQVGIGEIDNDNKFFHEFIAIDIKVLDRKTSIIKYQIDMVSTHWFKCIANLQYSNYGKAPEPLLDIVKNCISTAGLTIDDKTFDKVKSKVQSNYITQLNDNLFTALQYLFHKLYYFPTRDDSVKFLLYDWFNDKYRLFDLKNKTTALGTYTTTMSFFKTNNEMLVQQEPTNMGSLSNPTPKTLAYENAFEKDIFSYDYRNDQFICNIVDPNENIGYFNNKIDNGDYVQKYQKMFPIATLKFIQHGSYWNNQYAMYNNTVKMLEESNAFIMNITGEIRRQPGTFTVVTLDRTMPDVKTEDKTEFEKAKQKYKTYEGVWLAAKVRNIISPSKQSFRQQLVLFRNFIPVYKALSEITKASSGGSSSGSNNSKNVSQNTSDRTGSNSPSKKTQKNASSSLSSSGSSSSSSGSSSAIKKYWRDPKK